LQFNTVKIHFDGVHEIGTSAVLEPFSNDSDNRGGTLISQQRLVEFIRQLHEAKIDLHLHVVGDRATRIALDAYEEAGAQHWDYPRLTLCHLELVDEMDIARFKTLGVIANFTPTGLVIFFRAQLPRWASAIIKKCEPKHSSRRGLE
jgi:predicted amidohydrolase YtcJ